MQSKNPNIPDVAKNTTDYKIPLDEVGMNEVFMPLKVHTSHQLWELGARAKISIDLVKPEARGIHMSRLYLRAHKMLSKAPLSHQMMTEILAGFIESQDGLCKNAYLNLRFELPLLRKALITDFEGWKSYPITIKSTMNTDAVTNQKKFMMSTTIEVDYSSTCPCSAALSRRHMRDQFLAQYSDRKSMSPDEFAEILDSPDLFATPHGQRSKATVTLDIDPNSSLSLEYFINTIEAALTTPTQTAVKRLDEQQFAVLSGQNVMFAEDAARRVAATLQQETNVCDFELSVHHFESLHSHDAFARTSKSAILHNSSESTSTAFTSTLSTNPLKSS